MGLHLLFLPNFPVAMFIQGVTFIPDSRVAFKSKPLSVLEASYGIVSAKSVSSELMPLGYVVQYTNRDS